MVNSYIIALLQFTTDLSKQSRKKVISQDNMKDFQTPSNYRIKSCMDKVCVIHSALKQININTHMNPFFTKDQWVMFLNRPSFRHWEEGDG